MSDERSVIFVAGTSYSGTTALNLMLGTGRGAFAAGEVFAFFRPFRPEHAHPPCGCGDPACRLWPELRAEGEPLALAGIFDRFPDVRWVVDSSKDLRWITDQTAWLREAGVAVHHFLVWKDPLAYAHSMQKRGRNVSPTTWAAYHIDYFAAVERFIPIPHENLVQTPGSAVEALCRATGLDYFPGKEDYESNTHHLLFGNASAMRQRTPGEAAIDVAPSQDAPSLREATASAISKHPLTRTVHEILRGLPTARLATPPPGGWPVRPPRRLFGRLRAWSEGMPPRLSRRGRSD